MIAVRTGTFACAPESSGLALRALLYFPEVCAVRYESGHGKVFFDIDLAALTDRADAECVEAMILGYLLEAVALHRMPCRLTDGAHPLGLVKGAA